MEMHQIICDNLGMTRDMSISSLSKGEDGATNYAFENHNIRILAVDDNTKFTVTNEKSTKLEDTIQGHFLGGCTCGRYLVLFVTIPGTAHPDYIYRLEYNGTTVDTVQLYNGNLNFDMAHPIEAIGYYESEEIQKVYWVDGLNQNRFINIVNTKFLYTIEKYINPSLSFPRDFEHLPEFDKKFLDTNHVYQPIYAFGKNGQPSLYGDSLTSIYVNAQQPGAGLWTKNEIDSKVALGINYLAGLYPSNPSLHLTAVKTPYNDNSFDFQGHINNIPTVTITKNYGKAGTFQAGVLQYFMTYYNKYGVETCLIWNSDLQYLSMSDRGGKADEAIACAFEFEISNLDVSYDYLRVYSCYRSGLNGVVSSRIVTDVDLSEAVTNGYVKFTDYGSAGINFNAGDIPYIGGQDLRANTLDYKQDTLFLGDITVKSSSTSLNFPKHGVTIADLKCQIQEGGSDTQHKFITWAYKFVSPVAIDGLYEYYQEIEKSQKAIAGFKYREVYRFGIQFMDEGGTWTPAYWIGDKYCDLPPRELMQADTEYVDEEEGGTFSWNTDRFGNLVNMSDPQHPFAFKYEGDGCYIATVMLDIDAVVQSMPYTDFTQYKAYRLLVAETDITNRRIVEQGVINPTMFNYVDRYYNRPFSIPSWIFRPRMSKITNRHYDTLPIQTENNAELQGITERRIPGFKGTGGNYMNSFMFIFAVNDMTVWSGHMQWKLIYYNSGETDLDKAELAYLSMYTGKVPDPTAPEGWHYLNPKDATENTELEKVAHLIKIHRVHICPGNVVSPGDSNITPTDNMNEGQIKDKLKLGWIPIHIYGDNYRVVSSRIFKDYVDGSSWADMRKGLVELITNDMKNTSTEEVGAELAGQIVLSTAMLPDEQQLEDIGRYADVNVAGILMSIAAAIVAAAAIVLSVLSFGTLAPAMAVAATAAVSVAVSVCATASIGMASAAAVMSVEDTDRKDIHNRMLAKGYYPLSRYSNLDSRRKTSKDVGMLLERFFRPESYLEDASGSVPGSWKAPILNGEVTPENDAKVGNVPFTNGHVHWTGYLGDAYNAYVMCGKLSSLEEDEAELKKKQNLFCVDESIVTLNAPDLEDNNAAIDNSKGLRLDLVGIVPIHATYGIYDMSVEGSLNSSSQVLNGRYSTNNIGDGTSSAIGMLNGYLYQDFKAEEGAFDLNNGTIEPVQVNEIVDSYRVFMWNKNVAGFWFPGITLLSPIDADEKITSPKGVIQRKLFANMRYSKNSIFYKPASLDIESPRVCLDSQTMLKTFELNSDTRNYYENVDTISVNEDYYPMVIGGKSYPGLVKEDEENPDRRIVNGGLKDPVHIRYRQWQHVLIPLSWDKDKNAATILPYTMSEDRINPYKLYGDDSLKIDLFGVEPGVSDISDITYYWLEGDNWKYTSTLNEDFWTGGTIDDGGTQVTDSVGSTHVFSTNNPDSTKNAKNAFKNLINLIARNSENWYAHAPLPLRTYLRSLGKKVGKSGADAILANTYMFLILRYIRMIIIRRNTFNTVPTFYTVSISRPNIGEEGTYSIDTNIKSLAVNTKVVYSTNTTGYESGLGYIKNENSSGGVSLYTGTSTRPISELVDVTPYSNSWSQTQLTDWTPDKEVPYLFLGELVKKEFDYENWNGGTSDYALQQLIWNVASAPTIMSSNLNSTWGDTYYQRWDCLKTYPYTEQDVNSNVEVLSFMLESHTNLDGRCDVNRGIHNLLNVRPSNTIYNNVYSQKDNFFTYQVLDDKFSKQHFETDVMWSLTKNNMDDIDRWTSLIATNEMSLDGRYGPLRKILNVNDTLVAFQDRGISQIRYNETAALNTTSGLPLQMGNTGKVDGYRMISDTIGCVNKFSINKNSAGVFFADDFGKSFNQFTLNGGIADISTRANFSTWFKKNLNGHLWDASTRDNFRTSYDEITHDLYIVKNDDCLVYNTLLQKFTSFMDYKDTPIVARLISGAGDTGTFAIRSTTNSIETWKMFAGASTGAYGAQGEYGYIYGAFRPYSMEYRLNPDPMHDSIFTNYQYAADWIDPTKDVEDEDVFNSAIRRYTTFDTVEAKNEYQQGIMAIQQNGNIPTNYSRVFGRQPVKSMFRLWRGDIPRDKDTLVGHTPMSDRMRNPWIHLKFTKSTADDSKMKFHNLMVNYYNQYGRF